MLYAAARLSDEFPDDNFPGSSIRWAIEGFWHRRDCSEAEMPYLAGLAARLFVATDSTKLWEKFRGSGQAR